MIGTVVIKAIKACNLRCPYCYYINDQTTGYGQVISPTTIDRLYFHLADYLPSGQSIELVWHGGEPLMLGMKRFGELLEMQQKYFSAGAVRNVVQTNGTIVTRDWVEFLRSHEVGVGLSIDGERETHDKTRVTIHGHGTYERVVRALRLFAEAGAPAGVLSVINGESSGARAVEHMRELGVAAYDMLLPMTNNALQDSGRAPGTYVEFTDFGNIAEFLVEAFEAWRKDPDLDIRLFNAILANAFGLKTGYPYAGANNIAEFVVLEPNGDLSLDPDFWQIDRFGLGSFYSLSSNVNEPEFSLTDLEREITLFVTHHGLDSLPTDCQSCVVRSLCRGSHPASRFGSDGSFDHRSAYCEAMYALCSTALDYLVSQGATEYLFDSDLRSFLKRESKEKSTLRS